MITLYGVNAPYVYRVRTALQRKGLEFQHISVELFNKSDAFLEINPIGKIPALKDSDGTIVNDSNYILTYLDQKYPDTYPMLGETPAETAQIFNIVALNDSILQIFPPIAVEKFGLVNKTDKTKMRFDVHAYSEEDELEARDAIAKKMETLAHQLNGRDFFVAERFTAADAAVLSMCHFAAKIGVEVIPALQNWHDKHMQDEEITRMFPAKDEPVVGEI